MKMVGKSGKETNNILYIKREVTTMIYVWFFFKIDLIDLLLEIMLHLISNLIIIIDLNNSLSRL